MKAIVTWEAKANAGRMDYQYGNSLRPGDIVLMHDRPHTVEVLGAMLPEWRRAGFSMEALPAAA